MDAHRVAKASLLPATLARVIKFVGHSHPKLAWGQAGLNLLQALLPLVNLLILKQIVDHATLLFSQRPPGALTYRTGWQWLWQAADGRALLYWGAGGALILLALALVRLLASWITELHTLVVTDSVYRDLHQALARADYAFFENADDQNRLYLAREEALYRPAHIIANAGQLFSSVIGLGGVLLLVVNIIWWLPLALALAAVPVLFFRLERTRKFYQWRRALTPHEREAGYFHSILSDNAGARDIRLYGHAPYCQTRFQAARAKLREARLAWRLFVLKREGLVLLSGLLVTGLIACWMFGQLLAGSVTLGALVLCIQAVQRGQGAINTLLNATSALFEDALFLQNFEELLQQPAQISAPPTPAPLPRQLQEGITLENLTFAYPGTTQPALQNINLHLRPGERVALVGINGAGKSTLIKLLCRLYDPSAGRILVDQTDLRDFAPHAWRHRLSVLFQDYNHYQLSLRENIWIGDPTIPPQAPLIEQTAAQVGLDVLAQTWPRGFDSPLGRWLHNGIEPSSGQWQRIALARAFLRPGLLTLLDEPASALDTQARHKVQQVLQARAHQGIVLFASHRQLTPESVERVLILENGHLVADGTWQELSQMAPYRHLFRTPANQPQG